MMASEVCSNSRYSLDILMGVRWRMVIGRNGESTVLSKSHYNV